MPQKAKSTIPDLTCQEILDGRFCLVDFLSAGAYGKIYKARDNHRKSPKCPRYYAVKVLRKSVNAQENDMQLNELRLHKRVSHHPNIVTFYGAFEEGDLIFAVLELCEGFDLFTAIVDVGLFEGNDQLVKSCYIKILDAVRFCHRQGVFHRDLKPENILCSRDCQEIWLADFGLATNKRACCEFGCGSTPYMSPECIGKETNNIVYSTLHSDIWSLGVILVNMITGNNPWGYAHSDDLCFEAFLGDPNSLRESLPISDEVHYLLKRVFKLDPLARIAIPVLRTEVLAIETFYAPEVTDDSLLPQSSPVIPNINVEVKVKVAMDSFDGKIASTESPPICPTTDSDERILRGVPELLTVRSLSASDSGSEDVLVTPPHGPVDLASEVPEITDVYSEELGQGSSHGSLSLRRLSRFAVDPRIGFKQEAVKLEVCSPQPVHHASWKVKNISSLIRLRAKDCLALD